MKYYSKLRPFDLEAAKAGAGLCSDDGESLLKFGTGPGCDGEVAVYDHRNSLDIVHLTWLRMAPLAWVRKSADDDTLWPVYKGDVLYDPYVGSRVAVGVEGERLRLSMTDGEPWGLFSPNRLTFTPPKVKHEGWINIYSQKSGGGIIYASKREAEEAAVTSGAVQLHIEWEE